MIPLRLRKRRDGTLCLTDGLGRTGPVKDNDGKLMRDDREFPPAHWFTYAWLASNSGTAALLGDAVGLTLANATAAYKIDDRAPDMVHGVLVDFKTFDPPPIDEEVAASIAATIAEQAAENSEGANAGGITVRDDGGNEITLEET